MLKATLLLRNDGQAAGYNIQARFLTTGKQWLSKVFPKLEANQELTIEYLEQLEIEKVGQYPLIAKIHFKDAGGYPMTTVIVNPFTYEEITSPHVYGKFENLTLSNRSDLRLELTNSGYDDLNLDINIFAPDEISVQQTQTQLVLKGRSKGNFRFVLKNFSALVGAIYPVWATLEYDREDKHFTSVCSGKIKIIASENIFKKYWGLWLSLAGMIGAVFIWLNLKTRSKPTKH